MGAFDARVNQIVGPAKDNSGAKTPDKAEQSQAADALNQSFLDMSKAFGSRTIEAVAAGPVSPTAGVEALNGLYDYNKPQKSINAEGLYDYNKPAKDGQKLVQEGTLPDIRVQVQNEAVDNLQNPHETAEEKIRQLSALADRGVTSISLTDANGVVRQCQVEKIPFGKADSENAMYHLYTEIDGKRHPILRGIRRNGKFEHERDKSGNYVSYIGTWWTNNMDSKSSLGGLEN